MHARIDQLPPELQHGGIETRGVRWGDQLVRWLDLPPGTDFTPLFVGLPGDLCQSAHWGYVLEGSINVRYADGAVETTRAGELYLWPRGHTGWTDEGVVFVEFSFEHEIRPVLDHVVRQLSPAS